VLQWITTPLLHGSSHMKAVNPSYSVLSITWKWNILQKGVFFQWQLYRFHVWNVKLIRPSISWPHFKPKRIEIVPFHTDTKSSCMDTVLKKHTTSIFRQPPEEAGSKFLWNTAILRPHVILTYTTLCIHIDDKDM